MDKARKWIANRLAGLARRIYPTSEEVMSFYMDRMMEVVITGKSNILISHVDTSQPQGQRSFDETAEISKEAWDKLQPDAANQLHKESK